MSIDDPEQRGRIKVSGAPITADGEDIELDFWIECAAMPARGLHFLPNVGDFVEVVMDAASTDDAVFGETFMKASAMKWTGSVLKDATDIAPHFRFEAEEVVGDAPERTLKEEEYGGIQGYEFNDESAGVMFNKRDGAASFWGTATHVGEYIGGELTILGGGHRDWLRDTMEYLYNVIDTFDSMLEVIRNWGSPEGSPFNGLDVYDLSGTNLLGVARIDAIDYATLEGHRAALLVYWTYWWDQQKASNMNGWLSDFVFFKDNDEGNQYEKKT